jgi:hypothetical protein
MKGIAYKKDVNKIIIHKVYVPPKVLSTKIPKAFQTTI